MLGKIISIDYSWDEVEVFSKPIDNFVINESKGFESKIDVDIDIEADDIDLSDTVTIVWNIK